MGIIMYQLRRTGMCLDAVRGKTVLKLEYYLTGICTPDVIFSKLNNRKHYQSRI